MYVKGILDDRDAWAQIAPIPDVGRSVGNVF